MFSRILVGVDGTPTAARAAARAVEVAGAMNASVTLLAVGDEAKLGPALDQLAKEHAASGVAIDTRVVPGVAADALVDVAESDGYDLLVVGNKGMTGSSRFLTSSVPNKVSHHARCALLIVRTT
jgi:nucleotide-binding universal stress UspA family protein